jgi:hypothetical protein
MTDMTMDLSEYHSPFTSLFRDDSAKALLSEEQVEFFNGQGFLSGLEILSLAEIEALQADLSEAISGKYAEDPLFY